NEMVTDAPLLSDVEAMIREKVGDAPIVGHFINFDTTFLAEKNIRLHNPNLDTCQLAQALLWNESSYSLQVLGEKLGITHDDAHRALDDVKANVELFWRLCEHVSNLSKEEKEAIRPLLEKSSWPWAEHLLPCLEKEGKRSIPQNPPRLSEHHQEEHADLKKLSESLTPPFLFEEPSHTYQDLLNYALSLEGKSALVLAAPQKVPAHKDLGLLKDPSQYLDPAALKNLLDKERLGDVHSILGIKLTLWLFHSKTGEKSEMKLVRDESNLWFEVCAQEDDSDSFYNRAKKEALTKKVLLISHLHFLKDRIKSEPDLELPENVVIGQIENFTDVVEHAWHLILSESRFANNLRRLKEENPEMEEALI
ncbi:MAG: exonuclease domain-containing protein, partial [Patescibacteria group bacterium]